MTDTETAAELLDRMQSWDGTFESWDPQPGDVLVGQLVSIDEVDTRLGPRQVALIRDVSSGKDISVWLTRSVLRNEFEKVAPNVGDTLGFKFFGEQTPKDPSASPYFKYGIKVIRAPRSTVQAAPRSTPDVDEVPWDSNAIDEHVADEPSELPF